MGNSKQANSNDKLVQAIQEGSKLLTNPQLADAAGIAAFVKQFIPDASDTAALVAAGIFFYAATQNAKDGNNF